MSSDDGTADQGRPQRDGGAFTLGTGVRLLLWDFARESLAYDLALALMALVVLLVPGSFWGDPLWRP